MAFPALWLNRQCPRGSLPQVDATDATSGHVMSVCFPAVASQPAGPSRSTLCHPERRSSPSIPPSSLPYSLAAIHRCPLICKVCTASVPGPPWLNEKLGVVCSALHLEAARAWSWWAPMALENGELCVYSWAALLCAHYACLSRRLSGLIFFQVLMGYSGRGMVLCFGLRL